MFDSVRARRMMVDGQVRTADVTNPELLAAMLELPRERFVPPGLAEQAYLDRDLPMAPGRALLKPMVLAKLIQAAHVSADHHVLDVGSGLGYSTALLSKLAGSVVALEEDPDLSRSATKTLAEIGAANAVVVTGPLIEGWPAAAPYDVIVLEGATEIAPEALGRQLKPSGQLVCVFGRPPASKAMIFRFVEGGLVGRPIFDASASPLPHFAAPPAFVF